MDGNGKEYIKICPLCGSINIANANYTDASKARIITHVGITDWCKDCSYQGMFPEVEEHYIEKFRKKLKKNV